MGTQSAPASPLVSTLMEYLFYQPGRPALTNIKMILPDGQILMTGPATYTAQAAGGLGIPIAAYHYNHHLRR